MAHRLAGADSHQRVEGPVPRIAVHLAALRPGFEDPLSNLSLAQPHQFVQVLIDVGLIALLRIGSVWHKGVEIKPPKELAQDIFIVRWQDFQLTRLDGRIELNGNSVPVLPPYRHRVGGTSYRDIAESWLATAISSTTDGHPHTNHHRRSADDHVVNYFRTNDRRVRSWRRMSENFGHTRGFIIAEIYLGGTWHYLIDVEHKRAGELSMLLIRSQGGDRINARRFDYFMKAVAKHNGWQAVKEFNSHWRFATIRHAKLRGADALANLIQKSLRQSG